MPSRVAVRYRVRFSIFYPNIFKIVSCSRLAGGRESSRRENTRQLSENFHLRLDILFFESSSSTAARYRVRFSIFYPDIFKIAPSSRIKNKFHCS
jgi:hypothetical protein